MVELLEKRRVRVCRQTVFSEELFGIGLRSLGGLISLGWTLLTMEVNI